MKLFKKTIERLKELDKLKDDYEELRVKNRLIPTINNYRAITHKSRQYNNLKYFWMWEL
jgi:hypothetical protein